MLHSNINLNKDEINASVEGFTNSLFWVFTGEKTLATKTSYPMKIVKLSRVHQVFNKKHPGLWMRHSNRPGHSFGPDVSLPVLLKSRVLIFLQMKVHPFNSVTAGRGNKKTGIRRNLALLPPDSHRAASHPDTHFFVFLIIAAY